ncbi:MAG: hypothetical protein P1U40_06650 [Coxiellaceae bacterium]|nr:hypothetical protein [Coxiellaceae bacterium]
MTRTVERRRHKTKTKEQTEAELKLAAERTAQKLAFKTMVETSPTLSITDERFGSILCMLYRDTAPPTEVDTPLRSGDEKIITGANYFVNRIGHIEYYTQSLAGKNKKQLRDGLLGWVDAFGTNVDAYAPEMAEMQLRNYFVHALRNGFDDLCRFALARAMTNNNAPAVRYMQRINREEHSAMTTLGTTAPASFNTFDPAQIEVMFEIKNKIEADAKQAQLSASTATATQFDASVNALLGFKRNHAAVAYAKVNDIVAEFYTELHRNTPTFEFSTLIWLSKTKSQFNTPEQRDTLTVLQKVFAEFETEGKTAPCVKAKLNEIQSLMLPGSRDRLFALPPTAGATVTSPISPLPSIPGPRT